MEEKRRGLPIGAEPHAEGGFDFRLWAPKRKRVEIVFEAGAIAPVTMKGEAGGYFTAHVKEATAGMLYRFRLDGSDKLCPDPASRYQPEGPHGPSELVDVRQFAWTDQGWKGISAQGQVLYEVHVGTFTAEGTFHAARAHLQYLKDLGITCVELMPVCEFPGRFGWGYDGVDLFAPYHHYGSPDDLARSLLAEDSTAEHGNEHRVPGRR